MNQELDLNSMEIAIKKQVTIIISNYIKDRQHEVNAVDSADILDHYITVGANLAYNQILDLLESIILELEFDDNSRAGSS